MAMVIPGVVKRILKVALGVVVLLAVVHGVATLVLGRMVAGEIARIKASGDPIASSELAGPQIPESENGAAYMERALDIMRSMPQNMRKYESPEFSPEERAKNPGIWSDVASEIGQYSEVFALVDKAGKTDRCRYTVNWSDGVRVQLSHCATLRSFARLCGADTEVRAYYGDIPGAIPPVRRSIIACESLKDEPTLISMIVRCGAIAITCHFAGDLAQGPLDYTQAHRLYKALETPKVADSYAAVLKGERVWLISTFDEIKRKGLAHVFGEDLIRQHPMLKLRGTLLGRPLLYADELACLRKINTAIADANKPYRDYGKPAASYMRDSSKSHTLADFLISSHERQRATVDRADTDVQGTRLFIALRAYRSKYGAYPKTLSELRSKIPWGLDIIDPFSGKEFVYRTQGNGCILYSIGNDLRDDGGIDWRDPSIVGKKGIQGDMVWKTDL